MRVFLLFIAIFGLLQGCSKPLEPLVGLDKVAIVSVVYDPTMYRFTQAHGIDRYSIYADFSGNATQEHTHVMILNEYLTNLMTTTVEKSGISIVRPLKLLNTSRLFENDSLIRYEYLLKPYDPIDITNEVFMAGIADQLDVDAVVEIVISFGIYIDDQTLWQEYADPYADTLQSQRLQLSYGHQTSILRTQIELIVVDKNAETIYKETRFVDTDSDQVQISDRDLIFDGGVSPKLLELGLNDWIKDWQAYLPDYIKKI